MKMNKIIRIYASSSPNEFIELNKLLENGWGIKDIVRYDGCTDYVLEEII